MSLPLLLTACGHPMQRWLQGRWLGEAIENVDDEHIAAVTGWVKGTSFEFAGSSLTVAIPAEEPRSGEFQVKRAHEYDVELTVQSSAGQLDRMKLKLDDEHSVRWMLDGGRAVVLRREH